MNWPAAWGGLSIGLFVAALVRIVVSDDDSVLPLLLVSAFSSGYWLMRVIEMRRR